MGRGGQQVGAGSVRRGMPPFKKGAGSANPASGNLVLPHSMYRKRGGGATLLPRALYLLPVPVSAYFYKPPPTSFYPLLPPA